MRTEKIFPATKVQREPLVWMVDQATKALEKYTGLPAAEVLEDGCARDWEIKDPVRMILMMAVNRAQIDLHYWDELISRRPFQG